MTVIFMTGKYRCRICGEIVKDEPDILDEHLMTQHKIPVYDMCKSDEWDTEAIFDEYYERNV